MACVALLFNLSVAFAQNGTVFGIVTDSETKEPLSFATVAVIGSSIGAYTDDKGQYRLSNVPAGRTKVSFRYTGYRNEDIEIDIPANGEVEKNQALVSESKALEGVIIVGQAQGQRAAINEQVRSNTIVNVVSKERLQELPDQNAAETVGRLSGVSVQRDGGEGQKVVIRGLSPRFSSITVNGERLPSTDANDRSVDLSMVSPDMLSGIELYKALRPDMDGDAVGGTVNFSVRKADADPRGVVRFFQGYNDLQQNFGVFRGNADVSRRFLNKKIGVLLTGQYQRADRSTESVNSLYSFDGEDSSGVALLAVEDLQLSDRIESRDRYGLGATLDFTPNKQNSILYNVIWSNLERNSLRYRKRYRPTNNNLDYDITEQQRLTQLISHSLSGEHRLIPALELKWRGSFSGSYQDEPGSITARFRELGATTPGIALYRGIGPIPSGFRENVRNLTLYDTRLTNGTLNETNATAQVDLKYDFKIGYGIRSYLKVGGKYRQTDRKRENNEDFLRPYLISENPARDNPTSFLQSNRQILMAGFLGDYQTENFRDGQYNVMPGRAGVDNGFHVLDGVNINEFNRIYGTNYRQGDTLFYGSHVDINRIKSFANAYRGIYRPDPLAAAEAYSGQEKITAGYIMTEWNFGTKWMLMGGVRVEDTRQRYTSKVATPTEEDIDKVGSDPIDVAAAQGYTEVLPMAHLRYKPVEWFDVRLAVTKALSRPNFFSLVPWQRINNSEQLVDQGKPDLKHTTTWNYDVFLSFYNKYGLFTVGGFYKQLYNIDYVGSSTVLKPGSPFQGFTFNSPINIEGTSTVQGLELDLQGNLAALNTGFWKGLVFSANVTFLRSETFYPFTIVENKFINEPPFFITKITDTLRAGPVPGQADLIFNGSLGYETKRFSGRFSAAYQVNALNAGQTGVGFANAGVGVREELDSFDDGFLRFDLALKYKLDKKGRFTLLGNLNNFTDNPERSRLRNRVFLQEEEFYGFTAELGLQLKLF
jgi:TonB-dependent receptor